MKAKSNNIIMQNKVFTWVAMGTVLLLMIPFLLITFRISLLDPGSGTEVINWTLFDFIVMGSLIFGTGSLFVIVARNIDRKYWKIAAITCILGFLWLWTELAVGIFTNWGVRLSWYIWLEFTISIINQNPPFLASSYFCWELGFEPRLTASKATNPTVDDSQNNIECFKLVRISVHFVSFTSFRRRFAPGRFNIYCQTNYKILILT